METKDVLQAQSLQEILLAIAEENDECISVPHAYSGRGMHGKKCLAAEVYMGMGQMFSAILKYITDDNADEISEAFKGMKTDSMGKGIVVYFPEVEFAED